MLSVKKNQSGPPRSGSKQKKADPVDALVSEEDHKSYIDKRIHNQDKVQQELERYKRMIDRVLDNTLPEDKPQEGVKRKRGGEAFEIDTSDIKASSAANKPDAKLSYK